MDGQEVGLDALGGGHGARHRLGDVVELQVQEQAPAALAHGLDGPLALGHEQLEPDLVERRLALQPAERPLQRLLIGDVERDDDALARGNLVGGMGHVTSLAGLVVGCQRRSALTRATTSATASSSLIFCTSGERRAFNSTTPSASPFFPRARRQGMPMRSASLNFTPGRSPRSSYSTSTPAASSSAYRRSHTAVSAGSSPCSDSSDTS